MRLSKYAIMAVLLFSAFTATETSAKRKMVPEIYMFGFSASFNDSTVYFTNVQNVDSAWIETKDKFLLGRDNYSYQLKNYLSDKLSLPNRTCVVIFGMTRKEAEKKYLKMKRLYTIKAKGMYDVKYIDTKDFRFKHIDMSIEESESSK